VAEVPITHQNIGMTIKKIGVRDTLIKSKPALRMVVGHGTAKTGTLGYWEIQVGLEPGMPSHTRQATLPEWSIHPKLPFEIVSGSC